MEAPMGKSLLVCAAICGVLFVATTSRSDVPPVTSQTAPVGTGVPATPEAITGTPSIPAPGSESIVKDPFQPYSIGPASNDKAPKPFWAYSDLTPAEQAVVDRGRDTTGWSDIHAAYNTAVAEQAQRAAAASSAAQLGIDELPSIGVVP
jgi:hypothetical protein